MGQEPHLSSVAPIKFEMTPVTTILIAASVVCRLARRGINTLIARWRALLSLGTRMGSSKLLDKKEAGSCIQRENGYLASGPEF